LCAIFIKKIGAIDEGSVRWVDATDPNILYQCDIVILDRRSIGYYFRITKIIFNNMIGF
jgi:hypothetical protein